MNLAVWIERNGRRWPGRPALAVGHDVHADWATCATRVAAIAGGLRVRHGLEPGDRVAIVMRNRPEYLEALFAIWHAGAVPVNARLHRDEIAHIAQHSGARLMIVDDEHVADTTPLVDVVATLDALVIAPGPQWDALVHSDSIPLVDRSPTAVRSA